MDTAVAVSVNVDALFEEAGPQRTKAGHETEPGEIGEALAAPHLRLCEELRPDPVDLGRRLADLASSAEVDSYLHALDEYAGVLGDDGLAAYDTARRL